MLCAGAGELTWAACGRLTAVHALGRERPALLMEVLCATGIRVSGISLLAQNSHSVSSMSQHNV